jgi:hypothetical protein
MSKKDVVWTRQHMTNISFAATTIVANILDNLFSYFSLKTSASEKSSLLNKL